MSISTVTFSALRGNLLHFYIFLSRIFYIIAPLFLKLRLSRRKEHPTRYKEKLGQYNQELVDKKHFTIHIHGASVGETLSSLPVMHKIHVIYPDIKFVITSGTKTSAEILEKKLPDYARHIFAPIDTPQIVNKFFQTIQPNLTFIIDSEIWPNFLLKAHELKVPVFALNMRFSNRSQKRWLWFKNDFAKIIRAYKGFFVQNTQTAAFMRQVSDKTIRICSNLKWAQIKDNVCPKLIKEYQEQCQNKPIIVLLSTHDDEELLLSRALTEQNLNIKLIIIPRHPERGADIHQSLIKNGLNASLKSVGDSLEDNNIYIADTLGEIALWANLSSIIVMGKTFDSIGGGHNIIEPSLYHNAIMCGPKMYNFTEVLALFKQKDAIIQTDTPKACAEAIATLLSNPKKIERYAEKSYALCQHQYNSALSFLHDIEPFLPDRTSNNKIEDHHEGS